MTLRVRSINIKSVHFLSAFILCNIVVGWNVLQLTQDERQGTQPEKSRELKVICEKRRSQREQEKKRDEDDPCVYCMYRAVWDITGLN